MTRLSAIALTVKRESRFAAEGSQRKLRAINVYISTCSAIRSNQCAAIGKACRAARRGKGEMSERDWGMTARPERFWKKVQMDGPLPPCRPELGPCWLWVGQKVKDGYGMVRKWRGNGKSNGSKPAHRMSYELVRGVIPEGKQLDHLCRNRICVNPFHLEPVTNKENVLRGEGLCAANARKTACKRGHPLTPENVYTNPRGMRTCRTCARMRRRGEL